MPVILGFDIIDKLMLKINWRPWTIRASAYDRTFRWHFRNNFMITTPWCRACSLQSTPHISSLQWGLSSEGHQLVISAKTIASQNDHLLIKRLTKKTSTPRGKRRSMMMMMSNDLFSSGEYSVLYLGLMERFHWTLDEYTRYNCFSVGMIGKFYRFLYWV